MEVNRLAAGRSTWLGKSQRLGGGPAARPPAAETGNGFPSVGLLSEAMKFASQYPNWPLVSDRSDRGLFLTGRSFDQFAMSGRCRYPAEPTAPAAASRRAPCAGR
jgi:hypothetical protein